MISAESVICSLSPNVGTVDDEIKYYSNGAGLYIENNGHANDLTIEVINDNTPIKYIYIYEQKCLCRHDTSGVRYYNTGDKDTKKEKLFFLCELKKIYLKDKFKKSSGELAEGNFSMDRLNVGEEKSLQLIELERTIKYICEIIDIINEEDCNYGRSFEIQAISIVNALKDLKECSLELNETEIDEQITKYAQKSLMKNVQLVSAENESTIYQSDKYKFIDNLVRRINLKNLVGKKCTGSRNSQKMAKIKNECPEDYIGGLIRDLKLECLKKRRTQIEKNINRVKLIEAEIRKKEIKIRNTKTNFNITKQLSDDDLKKYERLLKAQRTETDKNYRNGMNRVKTLSQNDTMIMGIRSERYNGMFEAGNLESIVEAANNDLEIVQRLDMELSERQWEANYLREDRIPVLEYKIGSLQRVIERLKNDEAELNSEDKKFEIENFAAERKINAIEISNDSLIKEIETKYQTLSDCLIVIDDLKRKAEQLQSEKDNVEKIERDKFDDLVFSLTGGAKSYNDVEGSKSHEVCENKILVGRCLYKEAMIDTVNFALDKTKKGTKKLDEHVINDLWDHLNEKYAHSARNGHGEHVNALKEACTITFYKFRKFEKTVKEEEDKFDVQIKKTNEQHNLEILKRDRLREQIITKEDELNERYIKLSKVSNEKQFIQHKIDLTNTRLKFLEEHLKYTTEILLSPITEEISVKQDRLNELMEGNAELVSKLNEIKNNEEFQNDFTLCETRWRYSQYERFLTNIGNVENLKLENKSITLEIQAIDEIQKVNIHNQNGLQSSIVNDNKILLNSSSSLEKLFTKQCKFLNKLLLYTQNDSKIIQMNQKIVAKISKNQQRTLFKVNDVNNFKKTALQRKLYTKLKCKGTTYLGSTHQNSVDFIGKTEQLYKDRKHETCQNSKTHSQDCKYFDALLVILNTLLKTNTKTKAEIYEILTKTNLKFENHLLKEHKLEINECISDFKTVINDYEKHVFELQKPYTDELNELNRKIKDDCEQVEKKNKLVDHITVHHTTDPTEKFQNYIDCSVLKKEKISTSKKSKMNISQFVSEISEMTPQIDCTIDFEPDMTKMLNSYRVVAMDEVLWQNKSTCQQKLFHALVLYFNKEYLKNKIKIIDESKLLLNTEKEINKNKIKNDRIVKDNELLERKRSCLTETLKFIDNEIARVQQLDVSKSDTDQFDAMTSHCIELIENEKHKNKHISQQIKTKEQYISEMEKGCKAIKLDNNVWDSLKRTILQSRLKLELDFKENRHRNCEKSCDYFQKVECLLNYMIDKIKTGNLKLRHPGCKVSPPDEKKIMDDLKINEGHHNDTFKRIISYIAEKYWVEVQNELDNRLFKIGKLKLEVVEIQATKEASDSIIITGLNSRVTKIEQLLTFRKEMVYADKPLVQKEVMNKELFEYKQETANVRFLSQAQYLLNCLSQLLSRIQKYYNSSLPSINPSVNNDSLFAINKCIHDVFTHYCESLDWDNRERPLVAIINQLKSDVKKDGHESKFKILASKKTGKMGMVEYLVKAISQAFQEHTTNYVQALNPEYIYYDILEKERLQKSESQNINLEILKTELLNLKQQRKALLFQDNSVLRNELQNIETCIQFIENSKDIADLRLRTEELDHLRNNRDDYYSFMFENRRVSVRLLNTDPILKSAEIKIIDAIREYSNTHNRELLRLKVANEELHFEMKEKMENHFIEFFSKIQRKLFLHGFFLCRFDSFENGKVLDEINSIISTVIGVLVGESNLFQIGCSNEVTGSIEVWTRKIRCRLETLAKCDKKTVLDRNIDSTQIKMLAQAINEEFESDNLSVSGIKIMKINFKYFVIVPRDECRLCANNDEIDTSMKKTYVLELLKTDKDLWRILFERRLLEIFGSHIEICAQLGQFYKSEMTLLTKLSSLKQFILEFLNLLDTKNEESEIISLFAYLTYLEELETRKGKSYARSDLGLLKMVKTLYGKIMYACITAEEQRRQKTRLVSLEVSNKEQLYYKESLKDCEGYLAEKMEAMNECKCDIEKFRNLKEELLFEKMTVKEKYQEQMTVLSNISLNLKNNIKTLQDKIRHLNENQVENQNEIAAKQSHLKILQANLREVANEIKLKENSKATIELELCNLKVEVNSLHINLQRVNNEKERSEKAEREMKCQKDAAMSLMHLIRNFEGILGAFALQTETVQEELKKSVFTTSDLNELLEKLRKTLQGISIDDLNFWQKFIQDVNYEQLQQFILTGKNIAGETQHSIVVRLRDTLIAAVNFKCELQQDVVNGKCIKRFNVSAGNISSVELHTKIKDHVLREMTSHDSCGGLSFENGVLKCSVFGITEISELPNELKTLVKKRIELKYESKLVEENKNAKSPKASIIINELQISYLEIVGCYIDEIQIVACGTFFLNDSIFYPGIDLTIRTINMECVGEKLSLDTSGKNGEIFSYKQASNGKSKRNNNVPRGDKGYDGYDGDYGSHAGNIIIKVENEIVNQSALASIKADGGDGGEGQLGGDGDEGAKGHDGENGNAGNTMALQGGQTEIGFGKPGSPGGPGGACGYSGRPGLAGKPGNISIEPKSKKITEIISMNAGRDADNVLDKKKPSGGLGGEPGFYGMDEVRMKDSILSETKTVNTVIDRSALINKYPELTEKVLNSRNISSSLLGNVTEAVTQATLKFTSVFSKHLFAGTALSDADPTSVVAGPAILVPTAVVAVPAVTVAAPATIGGAAIVGIFADYSLAYNEANDPTQYRDRDRTNHDKRGKKNEEAACLRNENRVLQQEKRDSTNIESLQMRLNDKKGDQQEISGQLLHEEYIHDLEIETEEIINNVDVWAQEASDIHSKIDNFEASLESKRLELEKIAQDIESLKNKQSTLNENRMGDIKKIVKAINRSQDVQDKKTEIDLNLQKSLVTLNHHSTLREEYVDNYHDHVHIIDEYLNVVSDSLQGHMRNLKSLKKDYSDKEQEARILNKNLETIQNEAKLLTEIETEIVEEIQQEAEIIHEEEITQIIDVESHLNRSKADSGINQMIFKQQNMYDSVSIGHNNGQESKTINIMNNIIQLTSVERHILLNQLKKIIVLLSDDPLSNLRIENDLETFIIKIIGKIEKTENIENTDPLKCTIVKKLRQRFENAHLIRNDKLLDDMVYLVELINNTTSFNFQPQLDNQAGKCKLIIEFQNNILAYNRNPGKIKASCVRVYFSGRKNSK